MSKLTEWLKSGKYLPEPMRDFHSCKSIFKRLDEMVDQREWVNGRPDWITCHIYVIDVFLWFMAAHGYTLQRTRLHPNNRPPLLSLEETIADFERRNMERYAEENRRERGGRLDDPS